MDVKTKPNNPKRKPVILALLGLGAFIIFTSALTWNSPILSRQVPATEPTPTRFQRVAPNGSMQAGNPACGGPAQMLMLGLGVDENAQADVIRLVRVDFIDQKVRILSIPRDFEVPIPGFEQHGITEGRISAAYGYGEHYNGEGKGNGVIAVANTLSANYNLKFDRYAVIHIQSAAKWVDRVGGIDITLDKPLDAGDGKTYFEAGSHHINGEQALEFFVIRHPDSDIDRVTRQSQLLKVLYAKAVSSLSLSDLTSLGLEAASDPGTLTDISASDISALACLSKNMSEPDIEFVTIPPDMYHSATTELGGSILVPHLEVTTFIQQIVGDGPVE